MRTTLDLDEDIVAAARALARQEGSSIGRVISGLVRRGLRPTEALQSDLPVFTVPPGTAIFGPDDVAAALDEP